MMWLNGNFADEPVGAGALCGWGVFTTLGVWNGQPFAVAQHLARLRRDAARADVPLQPRDEDLESALRETIARCHIVRGIARISATRRGDGRWNSQSGSDVSILAKSTPEIGRTFRLSLSPFRLESRRALAGVKSTSYLDYILAAREAQKRGVDDALLCNSQGALCECSRANIFWVRDATLYTPSLESGCLPGVAREFILNWARDDGISVREGVFSPHELAAADEVFVSSSTLGAHPVSAIGFADDWQVEYASGALTQIFRVRWSLAVSQ